ncbi:MAG: hypothetical protein ACFB13_12660 [Kiloniellaceae bacterium]
MTASLAQPRPQERRRSRPEDRRPGTTGTAGGTTPPGLLPFDLAHLADLEPPPLLRGSLRLFAIGYRAAGPALTFVERDRIIGCAGLTIEGSEARAWGFFSAPLSRRALKRLHRSFRRSLPKLKRLHSLTGIRAEVHPDDIFGRRWLVYLGFRFDGVAAPCPFLGERMLRYLYR